MNFSKEHKLAFKIAILLFVFAIVIMYVYTFYNHNFSSNYKKGIGLGKSNTKYYIFGFLSIFIYFISYFLARTTIKPIEENNKKLKEYNHNLAHEIKTPIAVISSNLELLQMGYDKNLITSSYEELKLMQDITDNLLFLSENTYLKNKERISFKNLLEKHKNDDLLIEVKDDFIIYGNKTLIDRLLKNLIENAKKYGIKNEIISIFVNKDYFEIKNKIENNISQNEVKKIVDTFYKLELSRNTPGFGLGLSIVKKICELHNLKIEIIAKNYNFGVIVK